MIATASQSVNEIGRTYRCRPRTLRVVSTIADRIRHILKVKSWSQRELSRQSGFSADSQLGNTLRRLDDDPAAIELDTVRAIARGAGVSERWLLTGEGGQGEELPPPESGDASPRFGNLPNWVELVQAARAIDPGLPAWTLDVVSRSNPLLTSPATGSMVADLARLVMKHEPPPKTPV